MEQVIEESSRHYWERFLSDSSRLYALFGEPNKRLSDIVRKMAEEAK